MMVIVMMKVKTIMIKLMETNSFTHGMIENVRFFFQTEIYRTMVSQQATTSINSGTNLNGLSCRRPSTITPAQTSGQTTPRLLGTSSIMENKPLVIGRRSTRTSADLKVVDGLLTYGLIA